jgi:ornithine decarboxylase
MNKTIAEPPGRLRSARSVLKFPVANFPTDGVVAPYRSVDDMVHELRPEEPVHCLRPNVIASTAKWFLKQFPGDVMYAVKCNPDEAVLKILARAGVKHYDVASLAEVKLVAKTLPGARMYYMHPVKSRHAIIEAYNHYGVRDFSLDSLDELQKIMEATDGADDLNLYVRLSIPNESSVYKLAGKFGVHVDDAAELLIQTRKVARKLGVCFHVGSQCMDPEAYTQSINRVVSLLEKTGVKLNVLDIGGGFPAIYPNMTPPSLSSYMRTIKKALKCSPLIEHCEVVCEPGRALVAEGGSVVVQVDARKGNMLYINDGTYGSLFDAGVPAFNFPVKAIRPNGSFAPATMEFGFFGPTCDSMDVMHGPFILPADIREGDWIEIGQLGSYGKTMQTNFNGFMSNTQVEVLDKPLMSMFGIN